LSKIAEIFAVLFCKILQILHIKIFSQNFDEFC